MSVLFLDSTHATVGQDSKMVSEGQWEHYDSWTEAPGQDDIKHSWS